MSSLSHMLPLKFVGPSTFVHSVGVLQLSGHLPDLSPGDKDKPVERVLQDNESCDLERCECCEESEEECGCREGHDCHGCGLECEQASKRR